MNGERRAEGGGRMARPKPTGWKARATWHGLSSPCRGDRGSRRADGGGLAAKKRKRRKKLRPYGRLKFFHATLGVEMW